jgi:papain like cysteine protease AvrRpt2
MIRRGPERSQESEFCACLVGSIRRKLIAVLLPREADSRTMTTSLHSDARFGLVLRPLRTILWLTLFGAATVLSGCKKSPLPSTCSPPEAGSRLNVILRPQQTSMWCWAASGQMVMEFLGTAVTQCDEANKRFGYSNCCNVPTPGQCVQGGWPEFNKYGFTFKTTSNAALSWAQVKDQIFCKKKPFAFSWHWNGGGGHMMVLKSYLHTPGFAEQVIINDPWPPNVGDVKVLTYQAYVSGPGYTHWNDYYDVTK